MSLYRDVLYRRYSATFADQKRDAPEVQFDQYEATYRRLPSDSGTRIADLGCGKGEWLCWLQRKGFTQLSGVDGSEEDLSIAQQRSASSVQWIAADVSEHLEANPGTYDLLHAKDIIEHMTKEEFIRFLLAAQRALRPGGQIWLLTFNAQSPLSAATRYGDFTHESGHTPASLAQCLRACGFSGISIAGRHYCSAALSGRIRALVGSLFYRLCRVVLQLRHGSSGGSCDIDLHCSLPDLFAQARTPTGATP